MKVLTLNTWQERGPWQERWEIIIGGLQHFRPDILACQELFNNAWAKEVQKKIAMPTLIDADEPSGLVFFTQYKALSTGMAKLAQSPMEEYSRYALWADLEVGGKHLLVINTHLSWKLEDGDTRKKQVEQLLQLIQKKAPKEDVLIFGDFNAPPRSPEIHSLTTEGRLQDCFSRHQPEKSGFTWDNRNTFALGSNHKMPDRRIDYIFAKIQTRLLKNLGSCETVFNSPNAKGIWPSDHYGIIAEFR